MTRYGAAGMSSGTGRRLRIIAAAIAIVLVAGFVFVQHVKGRQEETLASTTAERAGEPPPVEVIKVEMAPPTQGLTLPGETRGWYSSTIYARVSGYVASWVADIGDRVKKDQVLAIIDTPDLDAQLDAAQAQLKASEAEVNVREADVEFAKTTSSAGRDRRRASSPNRNARTRKRSTRWPSPSSMRHVPKSTSTRPTSTASLT